MPHGFYHVCQPHAPVDCPLPPCSCQLLVDQVLVACFHPRHAFRGLDEDDVLNYEKRSPHPTINMLRFASEGNLSSGFSLCVRAAAD